MTEPGLEIERKFVLRERPEWLDKHTSVEIEQGYLAVVEGDGGWPAPEGRPGDPDREAGVRGRCGARKK